MKGNNILIVKIFVFCLLPFVICLSARANAEEGARSTRHIVRSTDSTIYVTIPDTTAIPGNDILIPVEVENISSVGSIGLWITFDSTVVQFQGIVNLNSRLSALSGPTYNEKRGTFYFAWSVSGTSGLTINSGSLFDMRFKYLSQGGSTAFSFVTAECEIMYNSLTKNAKVVYTNGSLSQCSKPYPSSQITQSGTVSFCAGDSISLTSSAGGNYTYQWIKNGSNINGATNSIYNAKVGGNFQLAVSNASKCSAISDTVVLIKKALPTILSPTAGSSCGTGYVNLSAKSSAGVVNWYSNSTGGSTLASDSVFTTPLISATTVYWVDATNNGCTTLSRTGITATIYTIPSIVSAPPVSLCGPGSVTLTATASAGTVNWYSNSSGGSSIVTGNTYQTPSLTASTYFWVDATANSCTTLKRTSVQITINPIPSILKTSSSHRCGNGTLSLTASASSGGVINWYNVSTGGNSLGSGTIFTTPVIDTTTTYYVDATANGCTTASRSSVQATVNPIPAIVSTTPASRCGSGSVTLAVTATGGTIDWFSAPVGGNLVGIGNSITVNVNITTDYYVQVTLNSCTSASMTEVAAVVDTIPVITGSSADTSCGPASLTLRATASAGIVKWYTVLSGGLPVDSGNVFNTPVLSAPATYYVNATSQGCTSQKRTLVNAIIKTIPQITLPQSGSNCGPGVVRMSASATVGSNNINWYSVPTGGTLIITQSYYAPIVTSTTTYYVDATYDGCTTLSRTPITAYIYHIPSISSVSSGFTCGPGTVTLHAAASAGTISWFSAQTGGSLLDTGTVYITPVISVNKTYYVSSTSNGCTTPARSAVNAVVRTIPSITSFTPASNCGPGSVNLSATASAGTVNWYNIPSGGASIATGTSFNTGVIQKTTNFYTDATSNGCTTLSRDSVTATINSLPTIVAVYPGSGCGPGSVTLSATASAGTLNWYNLPSGGASIGTGVEFQTPYISATTNYYVDATSKGCTSSKRTSVKAFVFNLPSVTITPLGNTTFCENGNVVLKADSVKGYIYQWLINDTIDNTITGYELSATRTGIYIVNVTDTNDCTSSSGSVTVTVNPLPAATATAAGSLTFCQGGSVVLNANSPSAFSYQWFNGNIIIDEAIDSSYTATASGSYAVVVTNIYSCSDTSNRLIVTSNQLPSATITPQGSVSFCQGGSVQLGITNYELGNSYQWQNAGANIAGATLSAYSAVSSGSYSVIVTNVNNCTATSTITTVTVNSLPAATVTAGGSTTFCQGGVVALVANTGSGLSWQWQSGGININGATTSVLSAKSAGVYRVIVSNANQCSSTSNQVTVTVNPLPTATLSPQSSTTFCQGGSVILNATAGSGLGYQWQNSATNIKGATSSSYTASSGGNYTVIVTNSNNCTATSLATSVTVNSLPTVTAVAEGPVTFCQGGSVQLGITNYESGNIYQWQNSGANITGATITLFTASSSGNYTVIATNNNNCTATSNSVTVTSNQLPVATITPLSSVTFCQGGSVTLDATTGHGLSYQWQNSAANISGATLSSYTAFASGNFTVIVTNSNNCTATSQVTTVTGNSSPGATITPQGSTKLCKGESVALDANTGIGLTWQWQMNANNIPGATTNQYTVDSTGVYYVIVSSGLNCSSTSEAIVIGVYSLPSASVTTQGSVTFCDGGSVALNANTGAGFNYQWLNTGADISGATLSALSAVSSGIYSVIVTNSNNCSATSNQVTVTVNPLPLATITPLGSTTFCQGGSVQLGITNYELGNSYQWQNAGANITGATLSSFSAMSSGNYTVIATNSSNCSATSLATTVTVNSLPTVTAAAEGITTFCQGGSVILTTNNDQPSTTYQWQNSGADISGATSTLYTAASSGNYTVIATNSNSCSATSNSVTVTSNPLPVATITPLSSVTFCQGGSVTLDATSGSGLVYQWQNSGSNISGATLSAYTAIASGNFTVIVTNSNNCTATSQVTTVTGNSSPGATITPQSSITLCQGETVVLNANTGIGLSWQWQSGGSNISGATNTSYSTSVAGSYNVIVSSGENCTSTSQSATVIVNSLPAASATANGPTAFCPGGSVQLEITNYESTNSYQWLNTGTEINGATLSAFSAVSAGNYSVVVTNSNDCSATSQALAVTINPAPVVDLGNDTTIQCQNSIVLNAGSGFDSYLWNNGSTAQTLTVSGPVYGAGSFTFYVTVSNSYGCKNSDSIKVNIVNSLYTIDGYLNYDDAQSLPLQNVKMYLLSEEGKKLDSVLTDSVGYYKFNNVINAVYVVKANITKTWGGGDPIDALLINRNYIKAYTFKDNIKKMAADVNADGKVNPLDALLVNRRYIKSIKSFKAGDWVFVPATVTVNGSNTSQSFIVVCYGDVNGSYSNQTLLLPPPVLFPIFR